MVRHIHSAGLFAVLVACFGAHATLLGCSAAPPDGSAESDTEHTGNVGLALQVTPGLTLNEVDYTIAGPLGFAKTGSINA